MTACDVCGTEVDPDVTHPRHHPDCPRAEWGIGWDCSCPEVCSACCTDPDCPTRTPQETPMDDSPYDPDLDTALDEEWGAPAVTDPAVDGVLTWLSIQRRHYIEYEQVRDNYSATIDCIRRLLGTVEQTRRERDAAHAALLAVLGIPDEDWQIDMWSEQYGDCVGMLVPTCICDRDHPGKGVCYCCDPINLTASQVHAIRRARAVPGAEEDQ